MSKILLIEDEKSLKQGLEFLLDTAGYQTVSVIDAEEAQQIFQHDDFDLIITDLMLPKGDGQTVIQMARKKSPAFPVICLTAYIDSDLARNVKHLVGNYLFEKPIEFDKLLTNIQTILS